jgi:hypothetical protein
MDIGWTRPISMREGADLASRLADKKIRVLSLPTGVLLRIGKISGKSGSRMSDIDVHWVTVTQLAILEPTRVETVACMIGTLLKEARHETVHTAGVPEEAAKAMLFGHVQIALTNALRGSNPFSEACEIAIQYGKDTIIKDDWKKIFDDSELDYVTAKMLKLEPAAQR